jgi:hypothetical protein
MQEDELEARASDDLLENPAIAHDGPSSSFDHIRHPITSTTRCNSIDCRLRVGTYQQPSAVPANWEARNDGEEDGVFGDLRVQRLVERTDRLGRPALHL